jgi:hypothetical protein
MKWLRKLLHLNGHEEINRLKLEIRTDKEKSLQDVKNLNKKLRIFIEKGNIELVIRDIKEVSSKP